MDQVSRNRLRPLFCPRCGQEIERSGPAELVSCPACELTIPPSVASGSPPFRRGFLPVLVAWALAPALLLAAAGSFGIGHLNLPSTAAGDVLGLIALLGGPFILYGWSAYLLRYKRVPSWGLKAVPLTLGMCIVNLVAGIGGCSLFGSLL